MCFFVANTFLGFGWRRNDENHVETLAGFRSVCVVDIMRLVDVYDNGDDDDDYEGSIVYVYARFWSWNPTFNTTTSYCFSYHVKLSLLFLVPLVFVLLLLLISVWLILMTLISFEAFARLLAHSLTRVQCCRFCCRTVFNWICTSYAKDGKHWIWIHVQNVCTLGVVVWLWREVLWIHKTPIAIRYSLSLRALVYVPLIHLQFNLCVCI